MANKKVDENKQVKKVVKKTVKKGAKAVKKNKGLQIAIVALVLAIVIAVVVLYLVKPDIILGIIDSITGNNQPSNSNNSGTKPPENVTYSGDLEMHMVDIGQGDCIYIKLPDGKDMLIDAGNESNSSTYKTKAIDYLDAKITDDTIEYLMLTHGDQDHVSYLDEVFDAFQVNNLYMPFILAEPANETYIEKVNALTAGDERIKALTDPDTISTNVYAQFFINAFNEPNCEIHYNIGNYSITGEDYSIEFFCYTAEEWETKHLKNAEDKNAVSPIGILDYCGKKVVLTGDANEINEPGFVSKYKAKYGVDSIDCDVLKVGHHGSKTSTMNQFLDFINVDYAMISCGTGNKYNHPQQAAIDRLVAHGIDASELYRTDIQGTVVLRIAEDGLHFTTEKQVEDAASLLVGFAA